MYRPCTSGFLAGVLGLISMTQAVGQKICRPVLAFTEVQFSQMQPPTMERKWTAIVSVDSSPCAVYSAGYFEIGFLRQKENGVDLEFRKQFIWALPSAHVAIDFWADEAVGRYWLDNVAPCRCRD